MEVFALYSTSTQTLPQTHGQSLRKQMTLCGYSSNSNININELCLSIRNGDLNNVRAFFANHSKDEIDKQWKCENYDFLSPIHEAAEYGHNDVLKFLLSDGICFDVNELTSVRTLFDCHSHSHISDVSSARIAYSAFGSVLWQSINARAYTQ